ncbi:uncharacterized protein PHACADRAFT_182972 [Phanerochaete carnosa HHB-10118-sp]|uniref:Uncharacterized protein n=1 Tax=Phanerochaete carnosa (strain HHB-10118-sp) TaxID=650164 RepID=K5V7H7_PHACS|nr:uncharacterized protein PHACADRAFT_182972 [Phanerochaete carnosa HHB-10118-sp]EKM58726.1 hypothetical protein PHACADRAFT_182972 [Phanerochaete carnosa HHB-10118-sp]
MSDSCAWSVYADQLVGRGYGLPLWHPEPTPEHGEIEVGDVGYVSEGQFIRLFNAMRPEQDPLNALGVPKGFVMLEPNARHSFSAPTHVSPGPICTTSTTSRKAGAGISDPTHCAGASYTFNCHSSRGAVAILGDFGHQEGHRSNRRFRDYIAKHHSSWYEFAVEQDYLVPPEAIILVSGWLKTTEWAVAAVSNYGKAHDFSFTASAGSYASANFEISGGTDVEMSVEQRSGPVFGNEDQPATPDPSDATLDPQAPRGSPARRPKPPCNQCMFVRYYKHKSRALGMRPRVNVKADAKDMIGPGDEHSSSRQPPRPGDGGLPQGLSSRLWSFFSSLNLGTSSSNTSTSRSSTTSACVTAPQDSHDGTSGGCGTENECVEIEEEPATAYRTSISDPLDHLLDLILERCPNAIAAVLCHDDLYAIFPPDKYPDDMRDITLQGKLSTGLDIGCNEDGVAFVNEDSDPQATLQGDCPDEREVKTTAGISAAVPNLDLSKVWDSDPAANSSHTLVNATYNERPKLDAIKRSVIRGNQGWKGVLGPPDSKGRAILQLRAKPGVLPVRLNRQTTEWYRILGNEVHRALELSELYRRKARRPLGPEARGDQDHLELQERLLKLKDNLMSHLELLMIKGAIEGPPYTMTDNIELTFLRKFIELRAAGIPPNPRRRQGQVLPSLQQCIDELLFEDSSTLQSIS